jgi:hypothetical protein
MVPRPPALWQASQREKATGAPARVCFTGTASGHSYLVAAALLALNLRGVIVGGTLAVMRVRLIMLAPRQPGTEPPGRGGGAGDPGQEHVLMTFANARRCWQAPGSLLPQPAADAP